MTSVFDRPAGPTCNDVLQQARAQGLDSLDAQLLLSHVLVRPRSWLLAHGDHVLSATEAAAFDTLLTRSALGEPLAYLLGEKAFYGLTLRVSPHVLVPRADTEVLVDWALALIPRGTTPPVRVLDLGTGSGAIALAIQHERPLALVTATDASPEALAVAMDNAQQLHLPVRFVQGHWLDPWQAPAAPERFDLIVSNPPYIAEQDAHLDALQHEPQSALTAGPDGLRDLTHIVQHAPAHLASGGWLLLEHGYDQHLAVQDLLACAGFQGITTRRDLAGIPRCTGGQWHVSL